jgi:squalene synthase HpnC
MRTADDFADEDRRPGDEEERLAYLRAWGAMLDDCATGSAAHPIFVALRRTLERHRLPVAWLRDLLKAFTMDVTVRRYATRAELFSYCRYSANPVGRLILTLFGYREEGLYQLSDAICTGLQLANHWQDVAVDLRKDRLYLPQEDLARFGVAESRLVEWLDRSGDRMGFASFQRLMDYEVAQTRELFLQGKPLPEGVGGRLRWELRMTWNGGMRVLEKIVAADFDVFRRRPVVTRWDWMRLFVRSCLAR